MNRNRMIPVALLFAVSVGQAATIEMKVYGLVCGFCAQGVEQALRKHPATQDVVVSLENKLVVVATKEGTDIPDAALTKAITDAGYDLKEIVRSERTMQAVRGELGLAAN